jgi:plasmid stabilization system protein ParE
MTNFGGASMARTRCYHPLVSEDLATAVAYYDEISVELGNRFRASVRDRIATITDRPDSFGRIHEQLRAAMVDRFPYVVLFEHEIESVAILGIFHAASDREGWFDRAL